MPKFSDLLSLFNRDPDKREPVKDILSEFVTKYVTDSWDDNYDILGYLPPCPNCHHKMRFNDNANMLQCPECGYYMQGDEYPYRNMPSWDEITEDDYK